MLVKVRVKITNLIKLLSYENIPKIFRHNTSLDQIDEYIRLVLKTFDSDDNADVTYEHQIESQFVRIRIFNRILN
ncbi:hypothetical protein OAM15_03005 [Pelagibacteraceae bacterium]|nr:hypothetical protein [Pelagibacteraceae bacterium]